MKRSKRLEISLLIGLVAAVCWGVYVERTAENLSRSVLRLHVAAASDSSADQALKLEVRDGVLAAASPLLAGVRDKESAIVVLENALPALEAAAMESARSAGYGGPVSVSLARERFPTRYYDTFTLPSGTYDALRVTLGEGAGQNWWCVVFPPLCLSAASARQPVEPQPALSPGEVALITEDGPVRLRFWTVEAIRRVKR
jgi:stage II sporulation protein R